MDIRSGLNQLVKNYRQWKKLKRWLIYLKSIKYDTRRDLKHKKGFKKKCDSAGIWAFHFQLSLFKQPTKTMKYLLHRTLVRKRWTIRKRSRNHHRWKRRAEDASASAATSASSVYCNASPLSSSYRMCAAPTSDCYSNLDGIMAPLTPTL